MLRTVSARMRRQTSALISTGLALALTATACGGGSERAGPDDPDGPNDPVVAALDPESYFRDYNTDEDDASSSVLAGNPAPDASAEVSVSAEEFSDDGGDGGESGDIEQPLPDVNIEPAESITDDNTFTDPGDNPFVATAAETTSTFGLDVDTGAYNVADSLIRDGFLPPTDAVRAEEYLNYFDYDYPAPADQALGATVDGVIAPYEDGTDIVRIGVNTQAVDPELRSPAAITLVVDVSGSMDRQNRLGLVQASLALLVKNLNPDDTIAVVTYSGEGGILLEPTPVAEAQDIIDVIDELTPGGGTNLEAGLRTGYRLANESFRDDAVNIVLLASDGVANIGDTGPDSISATIGQESRNGINLVTVGYGMGNFNDTLMEQLADKGDGFYSYLDDFTEAQRFFDEELTQTLVPVARDAKVQVEFDANQVSEYRLIGYENRALDNDDFRNDVVDAGELGSGHSATAIYQIRRAAEHDEAAPLGVVRLRWEDPNLAEITETEVDIDAGALVDVADQSDSLRLAHTVAAFADLLAEHPAAGERNVTLEELAATANELSVAQPNNARVASLAQMTERAKNAAPYPAPQQ